MFERLKNDTTNRVGVKLAAGMLAVGSLFGASAEAQAASVTSAPEIAHTADRYQTNDELQRQIETAPAAIRSLLEKSENTISKKLKPGTDDMVIPVEEKLATITNGRKYIVTHRYDLQKASGAFETFDIVSTDTRTGEYLSSTYMIDNELLIATLADGVKRPQVYISSEAPVYSANQLASFATGVKQLLAGLK